MQKSVLHCANCQRRLPQSSAYCPQCGQSSKSAIEKQMTDPPTAEFTAPFPLRSTWQLVLVRPDGEQFFLPLGEKFQIGRSSENDLPLPDHEISRFHALIEKGARGFQIQDLGSTNGTFVNRTRVHSPVNLRIGDTISIGQFRLSIQRDSLNCGHCAQLVKSLYLYCPHCGEALTGLSVPNKLPANKDLEGLPTDPLDAPVKPLSMHDTNTPQLFSRPAPIRHQSTPRQAASPQPVSPPVVRQPAPVRASKPPVVNQTATPVDTPTNNRGLLQGCAIAFVVALCLLAVLVLAGYWAYTTGLFIP